MQALALQLWSQYVSVTSQAKHVVPYFLFFLKKNNIEQLHTQLHDRRKIRSQTSNNMDNVVRAVGEEKGQKGQ